MNGSTVMYSLKPIIAFPTKIKSTTVMYEMKNIHEVHQQNGHHPPLKDTFVSRIKDQKPHPELTILEERQEKILLQLSELKEQIANLCSIIRDLKTSSPEIIFKPVKVEVILSANPEKPPLSILALAKFWKDSIFTIKSHIHSSVTHSVPEFQNKTQVDSQKNIINLRIIWENVPDLQLNLGPPRSAIIGETNFLRYLSRVVDSHNYEKNNPIEGNLIDSILDLSHVLSYQSPKELQAAISTLNNNHARKESWLLNKKEPSVVDIAVWSRLKPLNVKLEPNLAKWFAKCDKIFT